MFWFSMIGVFWCLRVNQRAHQCRLAHGMLALINLFFVCLRHSVSPPPFSKSKSLLNHLCKNRRTTVRGRRKHPYSVSLPLFSGCHNVSMIGCRKHFSRQLFPHRLFSLSLFPPQRTITAAHFFLDTFGH